MPESIEYYISIPVDKSKKLRELAKKAGYECEISYLEDEVINFITNKEKDNN